MIEKINVPSWTIISRNLWLMDKSTEEKKVNPIVIVRSQWLNKTTGGGEMYEGWSLERLQKEATGRGISIRAKNEAQLRAALESSDAERTRATAAQAGPNRRRKINSTTVALGLLAVAVLSIIVAVVILSYAILTPGGRETFGLASLKISGPPPIDEFVAVLGEGDVETQVAATVTAMSAGEPTLGAIEAPTVASSMQATPTPWPSIQLAEKQVASVPAGYTAVGDFSVCLNAAGTACHQNYDDDALTTVVMTWDVPGFVRLDFGNGWLEHVSEPQVFVDAQMSDGCGDDGCTTVFNLRWPLTQKDLAGVKELVGSVPSEIQNLYEVSQSLPAASAQVEPSQVVGEIQGLTAVTEFTGEWLIPSWAEVVSSDVLADAQLQAVTADVQAWMMPEELPLVPPDVLTYQTPPDDCVDRDNPQDSCSTMRLQPISYKQVAVAPGQLLRMTGDAISIRWSDTEDLLVKRPDGDEKHDLWLVLNQSSSEVEVDINAPYGSDRSWYTATSGWTPALLDELLRQAIQDFNLQYRDEEDFASTPVPNCEDPEGCTYSNIRAVIVLDDQVLTYTAKWFEQLDPHWEAFAPGRYQR